MKSTTVTIEDGEDVEFEAPSGYRLVEACIENRIPERIDTSYRPPQTVWRLFWEPVEQKPED